LPEGGRHAWVLLGLVVLDRKDARLRAGNHVESGSIELENPRDARCKLPCAIIRDGSPRSRVLDRLLERLAPATGEEVVESDLARRARGPQTEHEIGRLSKPATLDAGARSSVEDALGCDPIARLRQD